MKSKHECDWLAQKEGATYCKKCGELVKWRVVCFGATPEGEKKCTRKGWQTKKCRC